MKPLKLGQAPRTKFLVKELLYVPHTVYHILTKTLSPIKGHDSNDEEVVGIMKNLLSNIIHGIPINYHNFFMRTLANAALSPFELKPYAPYSSDQGLQFITRLTFKIISAICPLLKSSKGLFPQLMRMAKSLLLMKALVH